MDRRFESDSHSTILRLAFLWEENDRSFSIDDWTRIESRDPITRTRERTSKSTTNSFTTLNETDP
jgi:hypothetical protein